MIPVTIQLFGPVQSNGALVDSAGAAWQFCGNALSASTQALWAQFGLNSLAFARWLTIWTPNGNTCRLAYMDDGPSNIAGIASVTSDHTTPIPQSANVTDVLNYLIAQGVNKQLGIQFAGDGITTFTLYSSRLELIFN